jgi:uncharacterized glyoxalase superfamily protein PhnB
VTISYAYIVVDEVTFGEGGRWGKWSDGGGSSLELIDAHSDNRLASNWADSDDTSSSGWVTIEHSGVLDLGNNNFPIDSLQVLLLGEGECLLDNVEVLDQSGLNLIANPTFEAGLSGWTNRGTHVQSKIRNGEGFQSARSLHVIATARGDTGPNQIMAPLRNALEPGRTAASDGVRLYFEVKNLDAFCRKLAATGVEFREMPKPQPWGWTHAYLDDPDGHEVSLYWAGAQRLRTPSATARRK